MGLLLAWLPTLILACIVDRNPVSANAIRSKLNRLVDAVRVALLNPDLRNTYIKDIGRPQGQFDWTILLSNEEYFREDFFVGFAGQGRKRWHYGVAHSILAGIEESYLAKHGRDWLRDSEAARTSLVKGPPRLKGLHWFDFRELWQILWATIIVLSSSGGAFILSYWTPTVGLGCRSGGYVIYTSAALGIFLVECVCWWLVPEGSSLDGDPLTRLGTNLDRRFSHSTTSKWLNSAGTNLRRLFWWWKGLTSRELINALVLQPLEVINSAWLCYIILAQTTGAYRTCECQSSTWGTRGGYMDFETVDTYRNIGVLYYWVSGTTLSLLVMFLSFAFIVQEWGTQSHLSTENYGSACNGLMTTRRFKRYTSYVRNIPDIITHYMSSWWRKYIKRGGPILEAHQNVFIWTAYTTKDKATLHLPIIVRERGDPDAYDRPSYDDEGTSSLIKRNPDEESGYVLEPVTSLTHSRTRSSGSSFGQYDGEQHIPRPFLSP